MAVPAWLVVGIPIAWGVWVTVQTAMKCLADPPPTEHRLAIADRLAKSDPGNAGWQHDLSVSFERVGDVLVAQGNLPEALKPYRDDSLAIFDRLAKSDPGNAGWQCDLAVCDERLGAQSSHHNRLQVRHSACWLVSMRACSAPKAGWDHDGAAARTIRRRPSRNAPLDRR